MRKALLHLHAGKAKLGHCVGLHQVVLGWTGLRQSEPGCAGLHQVVLGWTGLRQSELGCIGLNWGPGAIAKPPAGWEAA